MMHTIIRAPMASFADLLLDAICMVDADGRFVFVSAACESIFGYTQQEMIGRVMLDMVAPADRQRTLAAARAIMDGHAHTHFENRYIRKDGSLAHIMWSARWSEADQLRVAVARDITVLKQTRQMQAALYAISEAAHASEDLATLFHHIHQILGELLAAAGLYMTLLDQHGQPEEFASRAAAGHAAPPSDLARQLAGEVLASGLPLLTGPGKSGGRFSVDSEEHWLAVPLATARRTIGALLLRSGSDLAGYTAQDQELLQFVAKQIATVIERKQLNAHMQFIAMHDELTGLPNRRLFLDRLQTAFARVQRRRERLSLLFLDLDDFKRVNDEHGHACGDLLLQAVAKRVRQCLRETDTLARLGGDEFVVLLDNDAHGDDVLLVEQKIHAALALSFALDNGHCLRMSASVGSAHYPEHGDSTQQLLRHADQAMYAAKAQACKQ